MKIWPIFIAAILIGACYVMAEVMHYRRGHDVYEWTKKLVKWMDKK